MKTRLFEPNSLLVPGITETQANRAEQYLNSLLLREDNLSCQRKIEEIDCLIKECKETLKECKETLKDTQKRTKAIQKRLEKLGAS